MSPVIFAVTGIALKLFYMFRNFYIFLQNAFLAVIYIAEMHVVSPVVCIACVRE